MTTTTIQQTNWRANGGHASNAFRPTLLGCLCRINKSAGSECLSSSRTGNSIPRPRPSARPTCHEAICLWSRLSQMGKYALVMMIDMFEHLTVEDGAKLLNELSTRSRHILVSVPVWHPEQDAMHGNVLQEHHAQYDVPKLRELGFRQIWRVSGNYIALRSATKVDLESTVLKCAATCLLPHWVSRVLAPLSRKLISG